MWSVELELPEPDDEELTDEEREELGISAIAPRPLATFDPLPGFEPPQRNGRLLPVEPAAVIETAEGVALHRHPAIVEIEHPELARYLDEFRALGPLPLTREDYRTRPSRYVEAWRTMIGAETRRRSRPRGEHDGE